jgi:hypothetical protein
MYLRTLSLPTVYQASVIAIYFVLQAKNYDGQYVGGGTDVYLIGPPDRTPYVIDVAQTSVWEKELGIIESWTANLLGFLTDPGISEDWISRRKEEFMVKLDDFTGKVRSMK